MADLKNCPQCGRVFASQGSRLCRKCMAEVDEDYAIVRKYVRKHPGADVMEVSRATGVKEELILQFLREGRLISQGFVSNLKCERCSAKISSGRFCASCLNELDQQLQGVLPGAAEKEKEKPRTGRDKMHINKPGP
ncbi:MAG: TIGR03826 family flagellar region protein [Syntrophomonadaceae bacterium]|jgi:flagellar operon protein (TIGR03826 family)